MQEVQLIEVNPQYAHIRYRNGREDTVATKYLAPAGERLPYKSLDQHLTDVDKMDDVKLRKITKKSMHQLQISVMTR